MIYAIWNALNILLTFGDPTPDLFLQAKAKWDQHLYPQAIELLEKLTSTFPASPQVLEAYQMLGEAQLKLQEASKAQRNFRYIVEASPQSPIGYQARVWLGRAYLQARKYSETLLVTSEILEPKSSLKPLNELPLFIVLDAIILQTRAYLGMEKTAQAHQSIDAFQMKLQKSEQTSFPDRDRYRAELSLLMLQSKLAQCRVSHEKTALKEADSFDHGNRASICILGAVPTLLSFADTDQDDLASQGTATLLNAYDQLNAYCKKPPPSTAKLSPDESAQYQRELSEALFQKVCLPLHSQMISLLKLRAQTLSPIGKIRVKEFTESLGGSK